MKNNKVKFKLVVIGIIVIFIISSQQGFCTNTDNTSKVLSSFHLEFINGRFFLWAQPIIKSSHTGYPIIFLFHGSVQHAFSWIVGINKWNKNQMSFTQEALDMGYFIVSLESQRPFVYGPRAWDIFNKNISENTDLQYVIDVISWLETSTLDVDTDNLFCTGLSSGAFMCSRIAISCETLFNAIAPNSGGHADCFIITKKGPVFNLTDPYDISQNHPPTLILHGKQDRLIPVECAVSYYNDLLNAGIDTKILIHPDEGHIWLDMYNRNILQWFNTYLK